MQSLWNDAEARACGEDALKLRVYTSRLLGREPSLVLHGGGNTSVKAEAENLFGDAESVLYVKGSGWDLATIEAGGFAPVRLDVLRRMAALPTLSDPQMVRAQRAAMTDPYAPNPSVEAILHAIIPFRFVDHTHADAVVTLTNTPDGEARIRALYGERVLVVPYVMPGFVLAKKVWEMTTDIDWSRLDGMVLMNHGVFSFADDARASYERMIMLVSQAEEALAAEGATVERAGDEAGTPQPDDLLTLSELRRVVSEARGAPVVVNWDRSAEARGFSARDNVADIATRGPLTPDHVIRTKRVPLIVREGAEADSTRYANEYRAYFERNAMPDLTCLDSAPRWAVWPGHGTLAFGASVKEAGIIADISRHTAAAIQRAECLGGWRALPERDIFAVEYWDLEQAKLRKAGSTQADFAGKVALVTGAASGIGRACADALHARGAAVLALDIDPAVIEHFATADRFGIVCDITDSAAIQAAVAQAVVRFGGLDVVVSNAGNFPANLCIDDMDPEVWERSLQLNLTAHQRLLQYCIPYLQHGLQPAVVLMASKNVLAPGPGAAAYSVAKAGLTQLGRVAALELAAQGIRVNMLHPDAVFDTGIWTEEVIASRARHYGLTVQEYKTKNLLRVEISAVDVADMVCALAGPLFAKTTGEQISIDGGNDRVI
ncbi:MAG: bifunctional aldolase/short-chain dehydrogenase [Gammaproteobacteria bacterium]|nr:bifunctional aldolase/short-chain dehydrogenase [Gammaproteobacteria bacterium]MCF6362791.1 bifunctional aldolase/short-chain dehydrogenase [Gammaproteobacteria bacterium]